MTQTHTVTEAELEKRSDWLMKRNKRILAETHDIDIAFYFSRGEGSLLYRLNFSSGNMLHNGHAKEVIFSLVRIILEQEGYDSLLFSSDTYMFRANAKGLALSQEEMHQLTDRGFKTLIAGGYGDCVEALTVVAQSASANWMTSCQYTRDADNNPIFGETEKHPTGIAGGRSQMFGEHTEPGMGEIFARIKEATNLLGMPDVRKMTTMVNIAIDEP